MNKRFRSARSKVRSSSVEQIEKLWDEVNWPIPILWAVLSDERSGVRLLGRIFCHALIWKAGRILAANSEDEAYEDQARILAEENIRLNKEVLNLRRELNRSLAEAAKTPLVPVPINGENEEETAALKRDFKGLRK
ncbi:MAG: hypothetical protein SV487_13180 [Thermodesulfobacteriota bacterium]|nr:hypothetical protein [Thermodesulfobacteriota bacterium]